MLSTYYRRSARGLAYLPNVGAGESLRGGGEAIERMGFAYAHEALKDFAPTFYLWEFNAYPKCEAPPNRRIEKMLVVRRRENDGFTLHGIDILQQADHNSLEFAE